MRTINISRSALVTSDLELHEAVENKDVTRVRNLIDSGARPNKLDALRRTPLDLLDSLRASRPVCAALRHELLRSHNPSAPGGHKKPEALHGSPWGFEILETKALVGGKHAPKGGNNSLEGMVFFSTRTPGKTTDTSVRADLRSGPRRYAKGSASSSNSPAQFGLRYQMASAVLDRAGSSESWQPTAGSQNFEADDRAELVAQLAVELGRSAFLLAQRTAPNHVESFERAMSELPVHESVIQQRSNGQRVRICGDALRALYGEAATALKRQHETSDAMPYLCLMNRGRIVPVVFGFEKVESLQTHTLTSGKQHAYQQAEHPLSGSEQGGRLTEIEVGNLEDLATLSLACLSRGVEIPADAVIRINPSAKEKHDMGRRAEYLTPQQMLTFQATLVNHGLARAGHEVARLPIGTLQEVNSLARAWAKAEATSRALLHRQVSESRE